MSSRFSLRFISGDRDGEVHELEGSRVTLGRKPGNTLQIVDSSVSGSHAELLIDDGVVTLRDRDSTNGTKVSGAGVDERQLAHGDEVSFGKVMAVFQDAELLDGAEEDGRWSRSKSAESDAVGSLSAAALEESGSRSRSGFLVIVAVVLLLGVGAWFGLSMFETEGGGGSKPVARVDGDLLEGSGSFEDVASTWTNDEAASVEFLSSSIAAATGASGMQAVLVSGEHASLKSPTISTRSGTTFTARASTKADREAGGRVGLLFSSGSSSLTTTAWSAVLKGDEAVQFMVITPPGYDRVRLVVEARATGDGSVSVDDASVVRTGSTSGVDERAGYGLHLLGEPSQSLCITKIGVVFVGGLEVEGAQLEGALTETGMNLSASATGSLGFGVSGALVERGVASLGEGGYQVHGAEFDREEVMSVLLGKGSDLVALHLNTPCKVRARAAGDGMRLEVLLDDMNFRFQVDFAEERIHAGDLAYAARGAERDGQLGDCLANWGELLGRYPYQEALVVEAEGVRGRLVQAGLLELQGVRAEVERASFFRLVELYRSCRDQAAAVGARYSGSEVETEAQAILEEVEVELGVLEVDLDADEVVRLRSIHAVLEASDSPRLADEVASYLESEFDESTAPGGE